VSDISSSVLPISGHLTRSGISKSGRTREKITDHLEASHETSRSMLNRLASKSPTVITGKDRGAVEERNSITAATDHANESRKGRPSTIMGTVSNYFQPRATRSSAMNHAALDNFDIETDKPKVKFSQTGELGAPWKKPLVYPKTGKKRETVDFQDLERLDDDEFLNDNLIGFYLRYLEHYLEKEKPEIAKKVYFFNSYFFERLTQAQKGTKGINYAAVEKWTRTVDIFSRDFVVVPVNENLHWYVAIICNLPNLRRKLADEEDEEGDEVESIATSETVRPTKGRSIGTGEIPQDSVEEPEGETRSSLAGLSLSDEGEAPPANDDRPITASDFKPQSSPKQKRGPGRRKSARRSLTKIDPNKPVVITLDSLGLSRTVTRTTLKDYIVEEGKAKRSLDLERGALEGVTAKGIPTQKNYSDCGLFLCAYMEKFVLDPHRFVRDILQRDMDDGKDWPMMSSHELRSRLRNVIRELHRQQEGEREIVPIPEVGSILLRGSLPPPPQPDSEPQLREVSPDTHCALVGHADDEAASQVNIELTAVASIAAQAMSSPELSQRAALKSAEDAINCSSPEESKCAVQRTPPASIVISDDTPNSPGPRHMSSKFRCRANNKDDFMNGLEGLDSNPQALAERMQRERSPTSAQGQGRSQSVTTDFMTGLESYARSSSPGNMPGAWANGEVPETPSQDNAIGAKPEGDDDLEQEILDGI
jgi:Ulp1 family protease